jgi:hypothetical protein
MKTLNKQFYYNIGILFYDNIQQTQCFLPLNFCPISIAGVFGLLSTSLSNFYFFQYCQLLPFSHHNEGVTINTSEITQ